MLQHCSSNRICSVVLREEQRERKISDVHCDCFIVKRQKIMVRKEEEEVYKESLRRVLKIHLKTCLRVKETDMYKVNCSTVRNRSL